MPAQIHSLAIEVALGGWSVVASPAGGGIGVPRRLAFIASPTAKTEILPRIPNTFPGVAARLDRLAWRAQPRRSQAIPLHRLLPLGEECAVEQMPDHLTLGIAHHYGNKAVFGHIEGDVLEAGEFTLLDQATPVDHRQAILQGDGEFPAIRHADRLRCYLALRLQSRRSPDRISCKGEHAVDGHSGSENILDGQASTAADQEVGLDGEEKGVASLGRRAPPCEQFPGY